MLARDMKDPLRALGALAFIWHGTQEQQLAEATMPQLIACFPLGYRGAKSAISALIRNDWLRENPTNPNRWIVRGNIERVIQKAEFSEKARQAALARWQQHKDALGMLGASTEHAGASKKHAQLMPPNPNPSPNPIPGGGERPPAARSETMVDIRASIVPPEAAHRLFNHWQNELHKERSIGKTLIPPPAALGHAKQVIALAGDDVELAETVVSAYVRSNHGYWADKIWPLYVLADGKDFERARLLALGGNKTTKVLTDDDIPF
jgi:hypothetical protein